MRMRGNGHAGRWCAPNVIGIGEAYLIGYEELVGVVEALLVEEHPKNGTVCFVPIQGNLACGGARGIERRHRRVRACSHGRDDESGGLGMRGGGPRLRRVEIRARVSTSTARPPSRVIPSLSVRTFFTAAERDGDRNDRKDGREE